MLRVGMDHVLVVKEQTLPWSTLVANLLGCYLVGFLYSMRTHRGAPEMWIYAGLMSGLAGGLTTFSSFALQALVMMQSGKTLNGFLYLMGSPLAGALMVAAGYFTVLRFWPPLV